MTTNNAELKPLKPKCGCTRCYCQNVTDAEHEGYVKGWNAALEAGRTAAQGEQAGSAEQVSEREAFERKYDETLNLRKWNGAGNRNGQYVDDKTNAAWTAWRDRAALASAQVKEQQ